MNIFKPVITALCVVCLSTAPAWGEAGKEAADGINIKADAMDHNQTDDVITASGNVVLQWQGATLTSDNATYDRTKKVLKASGNVVIIKGSDTIKGESVILELESGRGELSKGNIFVKQNNMHISADSITRTAEYDYSASQGSYTTCDAATPSWRFGAGNLDMTVEEYGSAKNVVFYIKDVPVFYFPYIVFPVKRERQSGFLFPRFGWSEKKGAEVDIFYYWAISASQEATIDLDIQSKRGVGTGLDYRYLRKQGSTGNLGGYLIHDLNTDSTRGIVAQSHREIFSPEMNLRTSINMTTDRLFLSDYGEKSGDYNRQSNDSTVNFLKTWQNYALTAKLRYTQDYYAASNNGTLQTLPEIGLAAVRQQIFSTPVYFDLDSSATNFYRESGVSGQRLYGFPRLTLVTGIPGYLNVSVYGGVHLRAYHTDGIPPAGQIKDNDGSLLPETGARLSTSFSKIHDINGDKLRKLRHEITPEVAYKYTLNQDQSRLPLYDTSDRIVHQNILYYSMTSFLGGKFRNGDTTEYRDLMRLKLTQGYSISGGRRDLLTMVDTQRPWTDLILESEAWLHPQARLTLDARYNVYGNYISSAAPGVELDNKRGTTAAISYRMAHNEVEYLEGRLATRIFKPWAFSYATRYSFDSKNFLESVYSAEYSHQCWSIGVSYRDRRVTNPGQSVTVNFNLMGAFGFGSTPGGLAGK
ncbi:MAG: LPS-assembly protein LptD [Verrucomicrobia bacterium]|nr:LPS-assembly protein LptD [Deltaproteobacteria bacterium]